MSDAVDPEQSEPVEVAILSFPPPDETGTPCMSTEHCSFGKVCSEGSCGACGAENDCLSNEVCLHGICLLRDNVLCAETADCEDGQVCEASGFSPIPPRNNETFVVECRDPIRPEPDNPVRKVSKTMRKSLVDITELRASIQQELRAPERTTTNE